LVGRKICDCEVNILQFTLSSPRRQESICHPERSRGIPFVFMLSKFISLIKDILFPVYCISCGNEGEWWCDKCLTKEKLTGVTTFLAVKAVDGLTAFFNYDKCVAGAKLIKQFKYNFAGDIKIVWDKLVTKYGDKVLPTELKRGEWTIIPVPLYPRRQRERGFNQAEVLSEILLDFFTMQGIQHKYDKSSLKRNRNTIQQVKLSGEDRRKNLAGAFVWQGSTPAPAKVILVDDVFTTGTTMQSCAEILKQSGTQVVWGVTLAKD